MCTHSTSTESTHSHSGIVHAMRAPEIVILHGAYQSGHSGFIGCAAVRHSEYFLVDRFDRPESIVKIVISVK